MITNIFNNKGGKLQKLLVLILLTSLLILVFIGINSAENITEADPDLVVPEEIIEEENITEEILETDTQNETNLENISLENETIEISNITNQTPSEPAETTSQSSGSAPESGIEETKVTKLDVKISHANQITRGISTSLVVIVTNIGDLEAKDVSLDWEIPSGFEIISGLQEEDLGNISPGDSVTSKIELQTTTSTSLGINKVKLKVNYENA